MRLGILTLGTYLYMIVYSHSRDPLLFIVKRGGVLLSMREH
jgi:hypothetical protein